jgi:hypothetical protein
MAVLRGDVAATEEVEAHARSLNRAAPGDDVFYGASKVALGGAAAGVARLAHGRIERLHIGEREAARTASGEGTSGARESGALEIVPHGNPPE